MSSPLTGQHDAVANQRPLSSHDPRPSCASSPALRMGGAARLADAFGPALAILAITVLVALGGIAPAAGADGGPDVLGHMLIAQEGGTIAVMRSDGERLWMGLGPRLVVVDASDPAQPRTLGRSDVLGGSVRDLAVGAVEPNAAGDPSDIAWALLTGDRLVGLDVRDPAAPIALGSVDVLTETVGIARVDDHVWAATAQGDLVGFDVSDPTVPRPSGRLAGIAPQGAIRRIGAIAGHVVVGTSGYGTPSRPILHVVDVRDAATPVEVGSVPNVMGGQWHAVDMTLHAGTAWIIGQHPYSLFGYDLGTPSAPGRVAAMETTEQFYIPRWVTVGGGRLYLTGGDGGHNVYATTILELQDAASPQVLRLVNLPRTSDPTGAMLALGDHFLYATTDGHLFSLDTRDPAAVAPVADLRTIGWAKTLDVDGERGLIGLAEAVLTVDQLPADPRPITATLVHFYPEQIVFAAEAAYVVTSGEMDVLGGELHTVDVADLAAPRVVSRLLRDVDAERISVAGGVGAIIARHPHTEFGGEHDVATLDLTAPFTPTRVGRLVDELGFQDCVLVGDTLYAAAPDSWSDWQSIALVIADVTDPANPIRRGRLVVTAPIANAPVARIAVGEDIVYLIAAGRSENYRTVVRNTLHVIDARDPTRPVQLAEVPLQRVPSAIAFAHGYVFLPGEGGVLVYDVRDPAQPVERGILPTGDDAAGDVRIDNGQVFVTAGAGGLYIFHPLLGNWPRSGFPTGTPSTVPEPRTSTPTEPSTPPTATPTEPSTPPTATPTSTSSPGDGTATVTPSPSPPVVPGGRRYLWLPWAKAER